MDILSLNMTYRGSRRDSLTRRINSLIYNRVFRTLFPGYPVRDVNSKPKAMLRAQFESGAQAFITKPFSPRTLLEALASLGLAENPLSGEEDENPCRRGERTGGRGRRFPDPVRCTGSPGRP